MQGLPTGKALAVVSEPYPLAPWIADKKQGPAGDTVSAFQAITWECSLALLSRHFPPL